MHSLKHLDIPQNIWYYYIVKIGGIEYVRCYINGCTGSRIFESVRKDGEKAYLKSSQLAASKVGKSWRIQKADIDKYLNEHSNRNK